ncbi:hypothetical protein HJC23_008102 [Cyclotella cryptica]|uniref:Uncharacterized protein n=1 Tax=Cyclotella cryptica TaxID=29204 RepID=A0ABD3PD76_9STRA
MAREVAKAEIIDSSNGKAAATKEEILQSHVQSILRLDNIIRNSASATAQKSFARHSSKLKQQRDTLSVAKKSSAGVSNSRSSSSNFAKRKHEASYDKAKDEQQQEEAYYESIAKALKKAKKQKTA